MKFLLLLEIVLIAVLCGCSESTTSDSANALSEMDVVAEVEDLPKCDAANEGVEVWVKSEQSFRICRDKKWFSKLDVQSESFSCNSIPFDDDSVKVVCNGDSVGTLFRGNGADGKNGSSGTDGENGLGCSMENLGEYAIRVVCGLDSAILLMDSVSETDVLDSEKIAVLLDTVSGTSQKGPFLKGSEVTVRELKDGRSLTQTGNDFHGKIQEDNGEFRINARRLMSQYVMLEANGYYRNEVTGKNSDSKLTLFGFSEVLSRRVVNVNLLTHLEYERVNYLVTKKKYSVKKAKKQAQQEVFNLFGIDATGFSSSEDLNVVGSSDEDGALLTFSIMFQGDRSVSQLSDLLMKVSTDMEKDGIWDDSATRIEMADWSADADALGRLDSIRGNVTNWHLSSKVPNFERYIRRFWNQEYGLDSCLAKRNGSVVSAKFGKNKDSKVRYICKSVPENVGEYRWVVANDFEKDTYGWTSAEDGSIKKGSVTDSLYYLYDAVKQKWRTATGVEQKLGACIESIAKDLKKNTGKVNGFWYKCADRTWDTTTAYVVDTQGWGPGEDAEIKNGDSTEAKYVYDEIDAVWRSANVNDLSLGLNGCTKKRAGETLQSETNSKYYGCSAHHEWRELSNDIGKNTVGMTCKTDGEMVYGIENTKSRFVCDSNLWRTATTVEEQMNLACTSALQGTFNQDSSLICDGLVYRKTYVYDFEVGVRNYFNPDVEYNSLYDARDGRTYKTVKIGNREWMAENLKYLDEWKNPNLIGNTACYKDDTLNCLKTGRFYTWTALMDIDEKWWTLNDLGAPYPPMEYPHRGICPEGWHVPTYEELQELNLSGNLPSMQAKQLTEWPKATNASGFTILPTGQGWCQKEYGGGRNCWTRILDYDIHTSFWSATSEKDNSSVTFITIYESKVSQMFGGSSMMAMARCVKDE
ncbi:MAG: hypothetical protein IKO34_00315 [Bacteroidales bacterium]|nr:hypothetical protein [Bacteroidales bacterium]